MPFLNVYKSIPQLFVFEDAQLLRLLYRNIGTWITFEQRLGYY